MRRPIVAIEDRDGIAVLRLTRGPVNALDLELLYAIIDAFGQVGPETAIVLTGSDNVFSAGVDLKRIVDGGTAYVREFLPALNGAFLTVFDHPAPVVAAVNGHAIAGGCVIVAACDVRVMSAGVIGLAELSVGVPFPTSALEIMRHALGSAAQRLVLGREMFDPAATREIGIVDQVVGSHELVAVALGEAGLLAGLPAGVFAVTKGQLHAPARDRIAARQLVDDAAVDQAWASPHVQQRIADYLIAMSEQRGARR